MKGATRQVSACGCDVGYFNPRSREGSDKLIQTIIHRNVGISIHAPVKGATTGHPYPRCSHPISIHAPVKGATRHQTTDTVFLEISIHAPVKGATGLHLSLQVRRQISIHAPVKGATLLDADGHPEELISIHAPVKGATTSPQDVAKAMRISIHAPVKGATIYSSMCKQRRMNFNPRSREGSDESRWGAKPIIYIFQSTLP